MGVSAAAARKWDRQSYTERANWWMSPACQAYYNAAVCGQRVTGSSEGCRIRLREAIGNRQLERGVSIGCGPGDKERALIRDGLVDHMDLWEISPRLATVGTQEAADEGLGDRVAFHVGNAFSERPQGLYDLVYWDHALHHMSDVGAALRWSVAALKPGGFVLVNDYIGPNRLQWTRAEVDAANAFLARAGFSRKLPYLNLIDRLKQKRRDPSEAPQSESIMDAMRLVLPGVEIAMLGGVLLNILGPVVVPATQEGDPELHAMLQADARLKDEGRSHFIFALWRKRQLQGAMTAETV